MTRYWTAFARTGDPNGPGSPAWRPTTGDSAQSLAPDRVRPMDFAADHDSTFWRSVYR